MAIRITCIKKSAGNHENPYTAISHLGWINEKDQAIGENTRIEIYDWVKGGGLAYVKDNQGNTAHLITAETDKGTKYVKTKADQTKTDNLLSLKECA